MSPASRSLRVLAVGAAFALALAAPAAAADDPEVVADGLDNPRGLTFGPGGHLYVAEAGRGGDAPCINSPEFGELCIGATGAVTRLDLDGDHQKRLTTGLPSVAGPGGDEAIGPSDVSFPKRSSSSYDSRGFLTVGLAEDPAIREQFGELGARLAKLYRLWPDGRTRSLADIGAFEAAENPDAGQPEADVDTNPNSTAAINGRESYVADAGGNSIVKADRLGAVELVGVLPFGEAPAPDIPDFPVPPGTPIPFQPVPTSLALGDDGVLYIGQLTGFPFPKGGAKVWRITPGGQPEVVASGFTTITDVALDDDGNLYVVQLTSDGFLAPPSPGALIRVSPDGEKTEIAAGKLTEPYGVAIHGDHAYVTQNATHAGTGQVVKIDLDEDD